MSLLKRYIKKLNRHNFGRLSKKINPVTVWSRVRNRSLQQGDRSNVLYYYTSSFMPEVLIDAARRRSLTAESDFVTNFIGVKVRPQIMPTLLTAMVGSVEGLPIPGNWHADIAEWGAVLHAVQKSSSTFRMIEVGCGWGCWMVNSGAFARQLNKKVNLIGIEGDKAHIANAHITLKDNGFEDRDFRLVHGVAGPRSGVALFPVLDAQEKNWGGEAIFYPSDATRESLMATERYQELQCKTLDDLANGASIDLLHVDIQGAEVDFVEGNFENIQRLVRRVLIGTHTRVIEGKLTDHFLKNGWALEMDRPAINEIVDGKPEIRIDGVQMWSNPNF